MKQIGLFLCLLFISGCATGYGSHGLSGGYSSSQLQPNVFQVRFQGNGYTSMSRARDFCLLRCAELCLENGFTHFELVDKSSRVSVSTYRTPTQSHTSFKSNYTSATTTTTGGQSRRIAKPGTENLIACYRDIWDPVPPGLWNAAYLAASLKQQYGIDD